MRPANMFAPLPAPRQQPQVASGFAAHAADVTGAPEIAIRFGVDTARGRAWLEERSSKPGVVDAAAPARKVGLAQGE